MVDDFVPTECAHDLEQCRQAIARVLDGSLSFLRRQLDRGYDFHKLRRLLRALRATSAITRAARRRGRRARSYSQRRRSQGKTAHDNEPG